jgi:hypothetical protein
MTALIELYRTDHAGITSWACKTYGLGTGASQFGNPHRARRETVARRLDLYRDRPQVHIEQVIDSVYDTPENRIALKKFVVAAKEDNVYARIVNEVASLYDRPALRTLSDRNDEFHAEEKRLKLHAVMQEAHRLTNLCNEVLLWQFIGVDDKTALRIVTPNRFDAVPDPRDSLVPAGYVLDAEPTTILTGEAKAKLPHWELWDDTYRYLINQLGQLVDESGEPALTPIAHGLSRIPGVLFHRREPTETILDADYGADIESAHLGVALLNVMAMRMSKAAGENQPILKGNLAGMASQAMNPERPLLLPPEVEADVWNLKTEPTHLLDLKKDKISSVSRRYGIGYEQYTLNETGDSASGKTYAARREKLTELRLEQRAQAVRHEEMTADLIGFGGIDEDVDFQEQAIPQDANEEVDLLDKKMRKGLDSPVSFLMRKDPDLTRDEAKTKILDNLEDFSMLVIAVRALNAPADGDAFEPGKTPQENGADNAAKVPGKSDAPANDEGGDTQASAMMDGAA